MITASLEKPGRYKVLSKNFADAIFLPEDAHKPCIAQSSPVKTRKLVVKVEVV